MQVQQVKGLRVSDFVDTLQASGRYTFRREEAAGATGGSAIALKNALRRLVAKRRLVAPSRGFYVIVPLEYRATGTPPASWFIDDLMGFMEKTYYVGLLTAASIHGAAHHSPQEFQVITSGPVRPITLGSLRLRFFTKKSAARANTMAVKTETGAMRVSTPEATALDLVRYAPSVGYLGNVATVLAELGEKLDPAQLLDAAEKDIEVACVQRLGYLLELVGHEEVTAPLAKWISCHRPRPVLLSPWQSAREGEVNKRWRVIVNERIEAEA